MNEFMWSKEHSLEQQKERTISVDIRDLQKKADYLNVEKYLKNEDTDVLVDIGGGFRGGALSLFKGKKKSILVDILANEFKKLGDISPDIETVNADFDKIPLAEKSADVIFAWEAYDHSQSIEHFYRSMKEMNRILKVGGLFFMALPLRFEARQNHPVALNIGHARTELDAHKIITEFAVGKPAFEDLVLFVISRKITDSFDGYFIWSNEWPNQPPMFYCGGGKRKQKIKHNTRLVNCNIFDIDSWTADSWKSKRFDEYYKAICHCDYVTKRMPFEIYPIEFNKIVEFTE